MRNAYLKHGPRKPLLRQRASTESSPLSHVLAFKMTHSHKIVKIPVLASILINIFGYALSETAEIYIKCLN